MIHQASPRETPSFRAGRDSGRRGSPPRGDCLSAAFLGNLSPVSCRPTAGRAERDVCGEVLDLWGYAVECGTLVKPPLGGIAKTKLGTPMGNLSETESPDCEVRNPHRLRRGGCQGLSVLLPHQLSGWISSVQRRNPPPRRGRGVSVVEKGDYSSAACVSSR